MKSAIIETTVSKPFDEVLETLRINIVSNGFLVLHEINTMEIMAKQGIKIDPLRQLLFFHPTYMESVLRIDPLMVNEVPLKIVVRAVSPEETSVSYPNPTETMHGYIGVEILAAELNEKVKRIVKS